MSKTLEAIHKNGISNSLSPVDVPDGAPVRVEMDAARTDPQERTCQLFSGGADPTEIERIIENLRQLSPCHAFPIQTPKRLIWGLGKMYVQRKDTADYRRHRVV